jgi:hypothetical protein
MSSPLAIESKVKARDMLVANQDIGPKAERERRFFRKFVDRSGLPIDLSAIESREPPEPDIYCIHTKDGLLAFELVELCNSELAKDVSDRIKRGKQPGFHMLDDPTGARVRQKIGKTYPNHVPIELLCYTDGLIVTPDDLILRAITETVRDHGFGQFRRIWLLGERGSYLAAQSRTWNRAGLT